MASTYPLTIAFFYEIASLYRSRGYSAEDCAELDTQETIDAIAASIQSNGYRVVCVGDIQELVQRIARGEQEHWDLAFSISEGMHGVSREAQIPCLLEAYQIPHAFTDAATLALCLDKGKTKMILEHLGIPTAPFAIVPASWSSTVCSLAEILKKSPHGQKLDKFPLFIKPACEGSSKGVDRFSKKENFAALEEGIQKLQSRYPGASILIEPFLSGREYSVVVIGTGKSARVLGTIHIDLERLSRLRKPESATQGSADPIGGSSWDFYYKTEYGLGELGRVVNGRADPDVQRAEDLALQAWRALECCDLGRVDVRYGEDGKAYVLEINPLPALHPTYTVVATAAAHDGLNHKALIGKVIDSALERYPSLKARRILRN